MLKQLSTLIIIVILSIVGFSAPVVAQNSTTIAVAVGYSKGNGKFNVVVKDTPNTKLVMYVNDKHPTRATVNKHDWATFSEVALSGTGKLSFTKVLHGKHGTYQRPIAYTKKYIVNNHKLTFMNLMTKATEKATKSISFTSTTKQDATLAKGTTQVQAKGVNGSETLTYQVTYTNAQKTARTLLSTVITTPPVNEVIESGTYVAPAAVSTPAPSTGSDTSCTNGTYVNSSGNTVCSPETASSAPAGATAKCNDGTYSFSQHHSGTCSGHGGVAAWL